MSGKHRAEPDVGADEHVSTSEASGSDDEVSGAHVGQVSADDAMDAAESGAEARSDEQ